MASEQDAVDEGLSELTETSSASVGDRLRTAREKQRLDLEHIAAETRIPVRHLKTIEAGDYSALPSRTYAIGFTRTYARIVGLDEVEIADAVREELADGQARSSAILGAMEPGDPAKLPSAGLAWAGGLAAIVLTVGVVAFLSTRFGAGDPLPSLLANDDTLEQVVPMTDTDNAGAAETIDAMPLTGEVVFTALEDGIWVRFYEDGGDRLFEATMASGESFELPGDATEPRINTGRPDAFAITIGGREVPKLADEPVTMGDTPISAAALLARVDPVDQPIANN
ncbi:MAG: RodZ domain-containing protein [Pseudomonadota bacterium]